MSPKSLSKSVLKKIKEQKLVPTAKWIFALKHVLFWMFFFLSLFIGAKAIALTIHIISMEDLPLLLERRPPMRLLINALPLFWIVSFMLFVGVASWFMQHTPKGYKWTLYKILSINILLSVVFGALLYSTGLARTIDRSIARAIFPRFSAEEHRSRLWQNPEDGLLSGSITEVIDSTHFLLQDLQGDTWNIIYGSEALWREAKIESGALVRLRGEKVSEEEFDAERIVPDMPRPMRLFKGKGGRTPRNLLPKEDL